MLAERLSELGCDGVEVRGEEVYCRCPFHADRHPSFSVNVERGAHCFVCGEGSFGSAESLLRFLAEQRNMPFRPLTPGARDLLKMLEPDPVPKPLNPDVLGLYTKNNQYFTEKWGVAEEVAERHQLRLDPYKGSECFPILDMHGDYWGCVERQEAVPRSMYRYPPGLRKSSLLLGEDQDTPRVWLVEGVRDLCVLETKVPHVRAVALGGSTPSEAQIRRLRGYDSVTLCLDNDEAGWGGTRKLMRSLPYSGLRIAEYQGKDPADGSGFEAYPAYEFV